MFGLPIHATFSDSVEGKTTIYTKTHSLVAKKNIVSGSFPSGQSIPCRGSDAAAFFTGLELNCLGFWASSTELNTSLPTCTGLIIYIVVKMGGLATQMAILIGKCSSKPSFCFPPFFNKPCLPSCAESWFANNQYISMFSVSYIMFWILDVTCSRVSHSLNHLQPTRSLVFTWKTIVFPWKIAMFHQHKTPPLGSAPWFRVPRATLAPR